VKFVSEIPDFGSDDEIAAWYETQSTALIQDRLESVPAQAGATLRSQAVARRRKRSQAGKVAGHQHLSRG